MVEIVFYVRHLSGAYIGEIGEYGDCLIFSSPLGAKPFKFESDAQKFIKRLKTETLYSSAGHLSKEYRVVSFKATFEEIP